MGHLKDEKKYMEIKSITSHLMVVIQSSGDVVLFGHKCVYMLRILKLGHILKVES